MDAQLLSRANTQEVEREMRSIRLAAAARPAPDRRPADPDTDARPRTIPAVPICVLRVLHLAS